LNYSFSLSQSAKNFVSNVALFLLNIGIGLWLTPFLINNIGLEAYGLFPLATTLTQYVALFTISITAAVSRFYTIESQKGLTREATKTFNTSFFTLLGIIIFLIPLIIWFSFKVDAFFVIGNGLVKGAKLLFLTILFGFLVSIFSSVFSVAPYSKNRLDLFNLINISRNLLRIVFVIILFTFFAQKIENVGFAYLIAACASTFIAFIIFKFLSPEIKISCSEFNSNKLKEVFSMGGWLMVNQVGYLLFLRLDVFIVNWVLGIEASATYGALIQWSEVIRNFAVILGSIMGPVILIFYAKKQTEKLGSTTKRGIKLFSLLLSLPIGIISGWAPQLLGLWIGKEFVQYHWVLVFLLIHLTINSSSTMLNFVFKAYNKLKVPGIATLVFGIFNGIIAFLILRFTPFGFEGIAISGGIILLSKNGLFNPIYAAQLLNKEWFFFITPFLSGLIMMLTIIIISKIGAVFIQADSWPGLFLGVLFTASASLLLLPVLLNKNDIAFLKNEFRKKV
jgi:O-antigen/teichoic acid export membrane protein